MQYDNVGEVPDATLEESKTFTEPYSIISECTHMVKFGSDDLDKFYGVYKNGDKKNRPKIQIFSDV